MTRHLRSIYHFTTSTKENKVKSAEHTAKAAVTLKIGRFATLRGVLRAQGSGASARGLVVAPLAALCVLLALCAGVARAEPPKLIAYGNFHAAGPVGVAVDNSCALQSPSLTGDACAAFDPSSGDVYTSGLLQGEPFGFVSNEKFSPGGSSVPPSPFGSPINAGVAVNPTNGQVDVLSALTDEIDVYDPTSGAAVANFQVPPFGNFGAVAQYGLQIATDTHGDVYVPVPVEGQQSTPSHENQVLEYSPGGALLKEFSGSAGSPLSRPTGVAVDPTGNVWVADSGNNRIVELNSSGAVLHEFKSEGVQTLAVDTSGDVFAVVHDSTDFCGSVPSPCDHLIEYNSSGAQLSDIGAGQFGAAGRTFLPEMVAVNDETGRVYVSDLLKGLVWIFGPPTPPVLGREVAVEVGATEAKLGAQVNPGGVGTTYRFEYGTTTAYGHVIPFPEGSAGQGLTTRTVWAAASGLEPGATYHFRVVAANALGTVTGTDETFTTETAARAACPNEALRTGFSASLPDCRAYELVTPPNKFAAQPDPHELDQGPEVERNFGARDGNRFGFWSYNGLPGAENGGESYLATRGAGGWTVEEDLPRTSYTALRCPRYSYMAAYSADLTRGLMVRQSSRPGGERAETDCNADDVEVVAGEPLGYENLLLRNNLTGGFELVNTPPASVIPGDARLLGFSSDLNHVVFSEEASLTADAPPGIQPPYEWDQGVLRPVSVLPDGSVVAGSLVGSPEGTRTFFAADSSLYVRENGEATVQIDESQGGSGASGGGVFQGASGDGSHVVFTDESKLTADSTAEAGKPDLYECQLPAQTETRCTLVDLTVAATGEHADVVRVLGVSRDGSYVYFAAQAVLAGNHRDYKNSEGQEVVEAATSGQQNWYVRHDGITSYIATVAEPFCHDIGREDEFQEEQSESCSPGIISPNGTFLALYSAKSLTGYENGGDPEIFLYGAASKELVCASCNPSGESPSAGGTPQVGTYKEGEGAPHQLTDGGQLFFTTGEALLPADVDGRMDVYEYEADQLHLISSGTAATESILLDVSESGNDVFFVTRQSLLAQDPEGEAQVIYDARVDGGIAETASPPACTNADSCRGAPGPQPSVYGAPASQTFDGAGNLSPAAPTATKAKVKRLTHNAKCKKTLVEPRGRCAKPKRGKSVRKNGRKQTRNSNRRGRR